MQGNDRERETGGAHDNEGEREKKRRVEKRRIRNERSTFGGTTKTVV